MSLPSPDSLTHEGRTFASVGDAIAYLQLMHASGINPNDIIILTPPPKS